MAQETISEQAHSESERLSAHPESTPIPKEALDGATHDYPADFSYWGIALFLAAVTAIEVSTYTHPWFWEDFLWTGVDVLVPSLLLMMAVKFWTVAFFFMHLRFDSTLLTAVFYAGLGLAATVYIITLATFAFFEDPVRGVGEIAWRVLITAALVAVIVLTAGILVRRRDRAKGTVH